MRKFLLDCGTRDATASLGILALRVMLGLMMLVGHGMPKLLGFATLKNGFFVPDLFPLKYMSPPVSLMACIGAEVVAALLIIVGLATRPAAFVLGFNMVVAAFGVLTAAPWFLGPAAAMAKEPALLYLIPLLAIILTGAGSWSLDAALYRESKRRRW